MKKLWIMTFLALAGLGIAGISHRTDFYRRHDPTGKYTAICSYRTYLSFLPMSPGSSNDKPCFVKIVDSTGENYGEIPVPMMQRPTSSGTPMAQP